MKGLHVVFAAGVLSCTATALTAPVVHAEPDINCVTGDITGLDTSSPGFVRPYPTACIDKYLAAAHGENYLAPGGETELVSLGKMICHTLDLDQTDANHAAANAVSKAEPKLTFTFTPGSGQDRDPVNELVS